MDGPIVLESQEAAAAAAAARAEQAWRAAGAAQAEAEAEACVQEEERRRAAAEEAERLRALDGRAAELQSEVGRWASLREKALVREVRVEAAAKEAAAEAEARAARALAAVASLRAETNPSALLLADMDARRTEASARRTALEAERKRAERAQRTMGELGEHFGKRGVQNLLYELAIDQLQLSAARYSGLLSAGTLQLALAFDAKRGAIQKSVRLVRPGGDERVRSVSQLSGGEWRRLAFALSLAFADFARARLGLSCGYLVFDEVMQHMDARGQAAMAELLRCVPCETAVVITHGLASDALYGAFDSVDLVEKADDSSRVRRNVEVVIAG